MTRPLLAAGLVASLALAAYGLCVLMAKDTE